jgi:ATP-dependent DNA helicase RecG
MFEFFSDRIEIRLFGPLPPSQTEEGFYRGVSKPVNKELSEVFSVLGISDRLGRGVPKIVKAYGKSVVKFNSDSIVVTIPFLGASLALPAENDSSGRVLNETQKRILRAIEDNRNITILGLMATASLSRSSVLRAIGFLKKKGCIRRIGSDKNGFWETTARS